MDQSALVIARTKNMIAGLQENVEYVISNSPRAMLARGKLYEFNRNFFEAAKAYRSIRPDSDYGNEARARLAVVLLKSGQADEGLRVAQEVERTNTKFILQSLSMREPTSIHTIVGDALVASGQESDAFGHYEHASSNVPEDVHAAAMLSRLCLKEGKVDQAAEFAKLVPLATQRYNDILANVALAVADHKNGPVIKHDILFAGPQLPA